MQINYTNTIPEIQRAYTLFRRKYTLPKMIVPTVLCLVTYVFAANFLRLGSTLTGYVLLVLATVMLVSLWSRPFLAQRRLLSALAQMGEEQYSARFFDDRIEVETELAPATDGAEEPDTPQSESLPVDVSVIGVTTEELFSAEDSELFCLFVNKALIYIFPKRCMTEEQIQELQKYFKDKAI